MKLGLFTPVVIQQPGVAAPWEATAGPAELAEIASAADELGYTHLTCSEHIAIPTDAAPVRGSVYWDPLATLAFLAAHTSRIRLATSVLVLGYHHPLQLAKSYGTLDRLSGGRVILGVGVGSLAEEFALLDAQWDGRGEAADRAIIELRAAWGRREVDGMIIDPHADSTELELWVGGRTLRSLRRALALGTGWAPFGLAPATIAQYLARHRPPPGFEVVLGTAAPVDPLGDAEATRAALTRLREAGATIAQCPIRAGDAAHYRAQLGALAEIGRPL